MDATTIVLIVLATLCVVNAVAVLAFFRRRRVLDRIDEINEATLFKRQRVGIDSMVARGSLADKAESVLEADRRERARRRDEMMRRYGRSA